MSHFLKNPHSVLAALEKRPRDVLEIVIPQKSGPQRQQNDSSQVRGLGVGDPWAQVEKVARGLGIKISAKSGSLEKEPRSGQHRASQHRNGREGAQEKEARQGVAGAHVRERVPLTMEELFANANSRGQGKGVWLALDSLQDPHNVGAIFRSAAFFGVEGILLTQERSAPLTGTVYDVASGGLEYVPFAVQTNLQNAFRTAKEAGLWILGTSEHARDDLKSMKPDRPWLLVLGNEEKGMRRLTEENCDVLCKIPPAGKVTSLNVAVSAGIFISYLTGTHSSS